MNSVYYIGLDVHKKGITFVIKTHSGQMIRRGSVEATRPALTRWADEIERPWIGALEATMFSGWVYDLLRPRAGELQVAHPLLLKAITCAKRKTIVSTPTRSATCCAATCCRAATWRPARSANCAGCCAIATWSCARRCG